MGVPPSIANLPLSAVTKLAMALADPATTEAAPAAPMVAKNSRRFFCVFIERSFNAEESGCWRKHLLRLGIHHTKWAERRSLCGHSANDIYQNGARTDRWFATISCSKMEGDFSN